MAATLSPYVNVYADIYAHVHPDSHGGAMHEWGSPLLVRHGSVLYMVGMDYDNTLTATQGVVIGRWSLWICVDGTWTKSYTNANYDCAISPNLCVTDSGRIFLSAMPTDVTFAHQVPEIVEFATTDPTTQVDRTAVTWRVGAEFHVAGYPSFAGDQTTGALFITHNTGTAGSEYDFAEWAYRTGAGAWTASGRLYWPRTGDARDIRVLYPQVVLSGTAVHFAGAAYGYETNATWHTFKYDNSLLPGLVAALAGNNNDTAYRQLMYAYNADITGGTWTSDADVTWVTVSDVDDTCGDIFMGDIYVDAAGVVHLCWQEMNIRFAAMTAVGAPFAGQTRTRDIKYTTITIVAGVAVVGDIVTVESRGTYGSSGIESDSDHQGKMRFQATADGRLFIVYYAAGVAPELAEFATGLRVTEITGGVVGTQLWVPGMVQSFTNGTPEYPYVFSIATPRGGSPLSNVVEVIGNIVDAARNCDYRSIHHAQIPLFEPTTSGVVGGLMP
jgi:hypothetical protein